MSPPPRYLVHIAFPLTYTMLIYEYMKTLKRLDMCTAVSTLIVYLIVTELHGWQVYYLKGPGKKGPRLGYIAIIGYAVMVVDVCIIDDIVHPVLGTLLVRTPLLRHWDDERITLVGHILDLRREACPWIIANPPRRWRNFDSNESIVDMCARLEMDDEKHQSVSRWRRWFWSHEEVDASDVAEAKKQLYGMIVDHQDLPSLASYSQGRTQVDLFQSNSAQPASSLDRHRMIPLRSIEPVFVSEEMILDQIIDAVCSYAVSVILTLRPFVNSATVTAWAEDMKFNRNGDLILHISLLQWLAFPWGPKFSILSRSRSFDFQGSLFDMKARLLLERWIWHQKRDTYEKIMAAREELAFSLMSILQHVLDVSQYARHSDWSPLTSPHSVGRQEARAVLIHLTKTSGLLPSSFFLTDILDDVGRDIQGVGGFADIRTARYRGAPVALKCLHHEFAVSGTSKLKALYREAIVWRQLNHPYILPFYGICHVTFSDKESACLVWPWMKMGDFYTVASSLISAGKVLPLDSWLWQVARGLEHLHESHIVHGDLRGPNILFDENLRVQLTDFGLASFFDSTSSDVPSSGGNPRWMAPELLHAQSLEDTIAIPDARCDIYSFACLCIEFYTRRAPFAHLKTHPAVMTAVLYRNDRPRRPMGELDMGQAMPQVLWDLVQHCWEERPEDRPFARAVVARLQHIMASG
ncbi:unnamed protein product [Somion occarium]|uniref:Protein kinase domain-containing protein n=1 Tax=Somion occarium TaxID=3059160 RepID=A0ABP1D5B3_9APHY